MALAGLLLAGAGPVPPALEAGRPRDAEEARLTEQRIAAATRLRATETEAAALATAIEDLALRQRAASERLSERAAALAPLLPLIERMALYPAETMLAVPAPPQDVVRGLVVLRGLARQLEHDAAALRAEQGAVEALSKELGAALPRLRATQQAQAGMAAALDGQIAAARAARLEAEDAAAAAAAEAARRAAAEAARADSVKQALAALAAERARAELRARDDVQRADRQRQSAATAAAASEARQRQAALARPAGPGVGEQQGPLMAPVAGTVVRGWGERTDAGPAMGVSYRAPPLARVVSPCSGRVVYGGPFRSYGVLLIVDCGGGFHFVLAGFDRLDVTVGTAIQAGEPVGVMPGWDPQSGSARPALYVELRRDGQPVNPAPFLRARG